MTSRVECDPSQRGHPCKDIGSGKYVADGTRRKVEFDRLSLGKQSDSTLVFELIYWDEDSQLLERQDTLQQIMRVPPDGGDVERLPAIRAVVGVKAAVNLETHRTKRHIRPSK